MADERRIWQPRAEDTRPMPHAPSARETERRRPPSAETPRVAHAQERRRTSGLVQSINERFIVDPENETLSVYDANDKLRVLVGNLGGSPVDYGFRLYNGAGDIVVDLVTTTWYLQVSTSALYVSDEGEKVGDAGTLNLNFRLGSSIRFEKEGGLKAEITYDDTAPQLAIRAYSLNLCSMGQWLSFFDAGAGVSQRTLTDSTGGTPGTDPYTLAAVSGTGDDANINDNFAKIRAVLAAYGLVG